VAYLHCVSVSVSVSVSGIEIFFLSVRVLFSYPADDFKRAFEVVLGDFDWNSQISQELTSIFINIHVYFGTLTRMRHFLFPRR